MSARAHRQTPGRPHLTSAAVLERRALEEAMAFLGRQSLHYKLVCGPRNNPRNR